MKNNNKYRVVWNALDNLGNLTGCVKSIGFSNKHTASKSMQYSSVYYPNDYTN